MRILMVHDHARPLAKIYVVLAAGGHWYDALVRRVFMDSGRPTARAANGMVATPHYLASEAGLKVLQDGGSAIDAAIAANAVLTVIYPEATSIGGDCFLIYYEASSGKTYGLNGSGRAPKAIEADALRAEYGDYMPQQGIQTVTVPGTIDAWFEAGERFGRFELDRLLQPAIAYARDGFPVSPNVSGAIWLKLAYGYPSDEFRRIYSPLGRAPGADEILVLPELADSLEIIARDGRDAFYTGEIAQKIAATANRLGGALSLDDLASHHAEWVDPLTTDYRDVTVAEMPPNSQGLTALIELNLAQREKVAERGTAHHLHPLIEAKKFAFQVRDSTLADPEFVKIDAGRLISKAFAKDLWSQYDPGLALAGTVASPGDTVYLCAVDKDGNAASMIQSIYLSFGSGVIADGTGIMLHCRGAYFSLDPNHPNRLEPGKRPLHTLMPGTLFRDGELWGPIGTQGGDAQAQVQLQLITNLVDYEMEPQAAIDAPRWVAGGPPGSDPRTVMLETRFPQSTFDDLHSRAHVVVATTDWDVRFGHAQMILRDPKNGELRGGADPRADGSAVGY
jgi:gamma-glutamyltranspeptidase/glutathione hydrolase